MSVARVATKFLDVSHKCGADIQKFRNLPEGTPVFAVPIRYWENKTPVPLTFESVINAKNIYCFHPEWGHRAFFLAEDVFLTKREALREIDRCSKEYERLKEEEFEAWWKEHEKDLLSRVATEFRLAKLDGLDLYRHLLQEYARKRMVRWTSIWYEGAEIDVLYPDPSRGIANGMWVRFPGSSDAYQWSPRAKKWLRYKGQLPMEEEVPKPVPMSKEEQEFYAQSSDDILAQLRAVPRSALAYMAFRFDFLPNEVLRYLESVGVQTPGR